MYMYYCRTLTGDYKEPEKDETGKTKQPYAALRKNKTSWAAYDSTVNRQIDPHMFYIFDADQVYPQYLIKYRA